MNLKKYQSTGNGQEIDLMELALYLWKKRKLYLKWGIVAVVTALVIGFSIPKEYTTTVKLAPESSEASNKIGNFGGLAAMAGIDLSTATGQEALSPNLYPDIMNSTPFLLELFPEKVTDKQKTLTVSLYNYMEEHQRHAWWDYVLKAPFRLLAVITDSFSENEQETKDVNPFHLTKKQENVLKGLRERINVFVDKKTMVITISVQMQDPLISAEVTRNVIDLLQVYITKYRTQKAKKDLEFTNKVLAEARDAYYKAQKAYAAFEDANKNIISASYRTEQERLRNEMTLTFNVYNTLAQKQEQDKLRVQEQTPVYTVIEPATVPLKASSPRKLIILIGFAFLSILGVTGYLTIKKLSLDNNG